MASAHGPSLSRISMIPRVYAPSVRARGRARATFRITSMIGSPENHATRGNGRTFWVKFRADIPSIWRLAA